MIVKINKIKYSNLKNNKCDHLTIIFWLTASILFG